MRILAGIGILAIIIIVGAAVFFFGGFYNVAASEPDLGVVNWALIQIRKASINHHASVVSPANLEDPEIVRAGAWAFSQRGCVHCHGAPGVKFSEGLNPDPPDLNEIVHGREASQLFWVVKNGIKMTAMPSLGAIGADDKEIWSIVAFVRKLPTPERPRSRRPLAAPNSSG